MYEILGLKHVFSTFQETVWSHLTKRRTFTRKSSAMKKEYRRHAGVASSKNAWMNNELTHVWVESVLGTVAFARRLLAWDSFECHIKGSVTCSLKSKRIDVVVVRSGLPSTYRHPT